VSLSFPLGPLGGTGPPFTINPELITELLAPHGIAAVSLDEGGAVLPQDPLYFRLTDNRALLMTVGGRRE
jgi:hypothetical protein